MSAEEVRKEALWKVLHCLILLSIVLLSLLLVYNCVYFGDGKSSHGVRSGVLFALSCIRNYEVNHFNEILHHLRKVLVHARKIFEPQNDSEPSENSVPELFSPEKTFTPLQYLMSLSSQSVQNKISCPAISTLSCQVRFLHLKKSQGFSTSRFAGEACIGRLEGSISSLVGTKLSARWLAGR